MHERQLKQIRRRLIAERERSLRGLRRLSQDAGEFLDRGAATLPGHGNGFGEDLASDLLEREKTFFLASREGRYLYRVQDALRRLDEDPEAFGRCERCREDIPFERLDALPHVRFCLACKLDEEAGGASTRSARAWADDADEAERIEPATYG